MGETSITCQHFSSKFWGLMVMGHHINSPGVDAFPGEARPGPNHLVLLPCLFALFEYLIPDVIMLFPELFGQRFEESLGHSRHGLLRSVYVAKGWLAFPSSGVLSTHCLTGRSADEFQARLTTDMAKRNRVPELLQPARSTISGQTNQISSADAGSLCATQLVSRHRI